MWLSYLRLRWSRQNALPAIRLLSWGEYFRALLTSLSVAALLPMVSAGHAATLTVGTGQMYNKPSQAFAAAKDGDTILVDGGTYIDDFAVVRQNRLHIEGVNGRPVIKQSRTSIIPNGKALWVINGARITIKNFEFSNAHCNNNCEGIRVEATGTVISDSTFHHNEFGLLSAALPNVSVEIRNSEFYLNGGTHTLCHQIYIAGEYLVFKYNYIHDAPCDGHLLKTRAKHNYILYNRITAEEGDQSSYEIDVPVGGETYIIGNIVEKAATTNNSTMIAYGEEGSQGVNPPNPIQAIYVFNNTMVNDSASGTFILQANSSATTQITNNLAVGPGALVSGAPLDAGNVATQMPFFVDRSKYDYRLTSRSPAINKAVMPGTSTFGFSLRSSKEYRHPTSFQPRQTVLDAGAYEYAPQ